tara:strand:- start:146 stop:517 length:372 start_codon:yes stop_codon:yes gene_type:complete
VAVVRTLSFSFFSILRRSSSLGGLIFFHTVLIGFWMLETTWSIFWRFVRGTNQNRTSVACVQMPESSCLNSSVFVRGKKWRHTWLAVSEAIFMSFFMSSITVYRTAHTADSTKAIVHRMPSRV